MYKKIKPSKTSIRVNTSVEAERIEQRVYRIIHNKQPISEGVQTIYTERKDGVLPQYDIRTDRFEIALDGMDYINKSQMAEREKRQKSMGEEAKEGMEKEDKNVAGGQPTQGTDPKI